MTIKGLIFDFDGLILDTETPEYQVLQEMFRGYHVDLSLSQWSAALGASFAAFDPWSYLEQQVGQPLDRADLQQVWRRQSMALIRQQGPMPGIESLICQARERNMKLGVASSSPRDWVIPHLERLELVDSFDVILTSDDVSHIKPHPELFSSAARLLRIKPWEAIAFEDSPNGITSAREAGIFCVAVLNSLTRHLNTAHASLVLDSLDGVTLDFLLEKTDHRSPQGKIDSAR